jgi:hypothetical protein
VRGAGRKLLLISTTKYLRGATAQSREGHEQAVIDADHFQLHEHVLMRVFFLILCRRRVQREEEIIQRTSGQRRPAT